MSLFKRFQWLDSGIPSDASPREGVGGGARPRLRTSAVGTTPDGTGLRRASEGPAAWG